MYNTHNIMAVLQYVELAVDISLLQAYNESQVQRLVALLIGSEYNGYL